VADGRFDAKNERNRVGKLHCPVCEHGLNPVVAVFSRTVPNSGDAALVKLVQKIDPLVPKYKADRLGAFVSFLKLDKDYPEDETRHESIKQIEEFAKQANVPNTTVCLGPMKGESLGGFGVTDSNDLTVVVYNRFKVVKRWTFAADKPPTDEQINEVVTTVENLLKPLPRRR
jgi:hypothetical protein